MDRNNFQKLEYQSLKTLEQPPDRIKKSINSNLGILQFIGGMAELFIPNLMTVFADVIAGTSKSINKQSKIQAGFDDKSYYPNQR